MATKRTFAENLELAKARGAAAKKTENKAPAAKQLGLELWPDAVRGVPNAVLRGALFGVSKERKMHKTRDLIAAVDGIEVRFKGEAFNQTDLDTWEMLLHLARLQPLGTRVEFQARELVRALGRTWGKDQNEQLKNEIVRLIGGVVEITWTAEKKTFGGALVHNFFRDEKTQRYVIEFNPKLLELYGGGYTMVDWENRQALGRNHLAKWLQGFYSSHAKPYPMKVATVRELSGSDTKDLSKFRTMLRGALQELVRVGSLKSWEIQSGDLVDVEVVPSRSQLKHLAKSKVIHKKG